MKSIIKRLVYGLSAGRLMRKGAPGGIYLTYDDGPHPENTPKILKVLSRYDVKATFFMVGNYMEAYPDIVRSVIEQGHRIGFHSQHHESLKSISIARFRRDLAQARTLSRKFSCPFDIYRPPFGDMSPVSLLVLLLSGWKVVMWSLDCGDSRDSLEQVKRNVDVDQIEDGDIILFHDDYPHAVELLDVALQRITESGLVCKTL